MSSSASVRSALGLVLVCGFFMSFPGLYLGHLSVSKPGPCLSVLQSYWNLRVWNRKEALFLSSVSRYLGVLGEFTSDHEYFALRSSVGCIGTFLVSVVSGRTRLPPICWVCWGLPLVRVAVCLSRVAIRVETVSYVGSWTTPKTTACGCFEHSTCGCLVRVL